MENRQSSKEQASSFSHQRDISEFTHAFGHDVTDYPYKPEDHIAHDTKLFSKTRNMFVGLYEVRSRQKHYENEIFQRKIKWAARLGFAVLLSTLVVVFSGKIGLVILANAIPPVVAVTVSQDTIADLIQSAKQVISGAILSTAVILIFIVITGASLQPLTFFIWIAIFVTTFIIAAMGLPPLIQKMCLFTFLIAMLDKDMLRISRGFELIIAVVVGVCCALIPSIIFQAPRATYLTEEHAHRVSFDVCQALKMLLRVFLSDTEMDFQVNLIKSKEILKIAESQLHLMKLSIQNASNEFFIKNSKNILIGLHHRCSLYQCTLDALNSMFHALKNTHVTSSKTMKEICFYITLSLQHSVDGLCEALYYKEEQLKQHDDDDIETYTNNNHIDSNNNIDINNYGGWRDRSSGSQCCDSSQVIHPVDARGVKSCLRSLANDYLDARRMFLWESRDSRVDWTQRSLMHINTFIFYLSYLMRHVTEYDQAPSSSSSSSSVTSSELPTQQQQQHVVVGAENMHDHDSNYTTTIPTSSPTSNSNSNSLLFLRGYWTFLRNYFRRTLVPKLRSCVMIHRKPVHVIRYALQLAIAISLASLLTLWGDVNQYFHTFTSWSALTIAMLSNHSSLSSFAVSVSRLIGTLLGSVSGSFGLIIALQNKYLLVLFASFWVGLTSIMRSHPMFGPSIVVSGLTAIVIMFQFNPDKVTDPRL